MQSEETNELSALVRPGEFWFEHPRYPGYLVGAHGAVISLRSKPSPKILTPIRIGNYDGYQLRRYDGVVKNEYRHRLVAETMFGESRGMECCHKDGDRANCDFTNLRWGTRAENEADKRRHGTAPVGERHPSAKLTDANVRTMRGVRAVTGATYKQIAAQFGVSVMTAYRAIRGKSWEHV